MPGKSVLIIPDAHATPERDNKRFTWLGRYIDDVRPDTIVCLGDFADLASLNETAIRTTGPIALEGKRYRKDIEAVDDALDKLHSPWARRRYSPKLYMLHGNHEYFIQRAINRDPRLEGTLCISDLGYSDYGWKEIPFLSPLFYAGFAFSHYFAAGVSGRAIGGKHIAGRLVAVNHMSSVVGHNHTYDFHQEARPDGSSVIGISAGCYVHPEDVEQWNIQTHKKWWGGVVLLRGARAGGFSCIERPGLVELKERYA